MIFRDHWKGIPEQLQYLTVFQFLILSLVAFSPMVQSPLEAIHFKMLLLFIIIARNTVFPRK